MIGVEHIKSTFKSNLTKSNTLPLKFDNIAFDFLPSHTYEDFQFQFNDQRTYRRDKKQTKVEEISTDCSSPDSYLEDP